MKKYILGGIIIASSIFISADLSAQNIEKSKTTHSKTKKAAKKGWDANGDKQITKNEAIASKNKRLILNFDSWDTNKDGVLSKAEWGAMKKSSNGVKPDSGISREKK